MTERIWPVPTLAELLAEPERIDTLPVGAVAGLVVQLAGLQQRLGARLVVAGPVSANPAQPDELLDTAAAARRLGISPSTLAHGAQRMPYLALAVPTGSRRRRYSGQKIAAFLRGDLDGPAEQGTRRARRWAASARPPRGGAR